MKTKNLLKSLKRRLGLITAILAMLLVSQGAFAWGWVVRCTDKQSSENPSCYLGDEITFWWCFNGDGAGASFKRACISTNSSSAGTWNDNVSWQKDGCDGDGNKQYNAKFKPSSSGDWYYSLWLGWGSSVGDNGRYYDGSSSWNDGSDSYKSSKFTVKAVPAPKSCSIEVTNAASGTGTQADPYIVRPGASYTVKVTATKADGFTGSGYAFNINTTSSKTGAGTTASYSKNYTAGTAGSSAEYTGYAWHYNGSTSYYSSSYATSSKIYVSVQSACTDPTVTTTAATSISTTTATLGGSYTGGSATPTEVGIEWTQGKSGSIAASSVSKSFTVSATGLTAGTTYKYKAYAVACGGSKVYGSEQTFKTDNAYYVSGSFTSWGQGQEMTKQSSGDYSGKYTCDIDLSANGTFKLRNGGGQWLGKDNTTITRNNSTVSGMTFPDAGDSGGDISITIDGNGSYKFVYDAVNSTLTVEYPAGCEKAVPVAVYGSSIFSRTNFKPKFKVTSIGDCGIKEAGVKVYSDASCTTLVKTATYSSPSNIEANKEYTLNVTELTNNTKYYCKAYIKTNDDETVLSSNTVEQATKLYAAANGSTPVSCTEQTLKADVYKGGANVTSVSNIKFNVYSDAACTALVGTFTGSAIANLNTSTATTATATGLTPNTQYWFRITATASTTLNGSSVDVSATSDASGTKYTFTTAAPSITPTQSSITFATHVVLGQESSALKIADYTFCGHSFTTSDFALTGDNATDFTLTQQSVSSGTASVKIRFTPKSGIGAKSANLVVKEGGNVISTIPVSATADCIIPTKANYSVSGNTHTYDGSPKTAVIGPNTGTYGTFTTGTATYGGQASQINVGEYTIHYTVPVGGNYCATNFDFDEKLTISNATLPDITGLPSGATKCAGETEQLSPVCAGATSWEYSSSNTSVATVSTDGLITFEGAGNATITVTAKATNYNNKTKDVSVTTKAGPAVSASATNTTAYEVITLTSTSGSVTWSKSDAAAYFVKDQKAVDGNTVEAAEVNFKAPAKVGAYTVGATSNGCTSNLSITISTPTEVCN